MKKLKVLIWLAVLCLGCSSTNPKVFDLTAELSEEETDRLSRLAPWTRRNVLVYLIGDYKIISPAADPGPTIHVHRKDGPFIIIGDHPPGLPGLSKEGKQVMTIFRNGRVFIMDLFGSALVINETANENLNSTPRVSISDSDGDGIYDHLSYTAFDSEGHPVIDVNDLDLDGEADLKIVHTGEERECYAWIESGWHLIERRGKHPCVFSGGQWRPIMLDGAKWKFKD